MGRDRTFSDDQRDAAIGAVVLGGMSYADAALAAAAGELAVEPFEPAPTTVQGWVAAHTRREGVRLAGLPETERVRAVAEKTIARVESLDSPTARDLHAMQQAHKMLQDADRMTRRLAPPPEREPTGEKSALVLEMEADLKRLLAAEAEIAAGRPCPHVICDRWGYCRVCREQNLGGDRPDPPEDTAAA
jgi:hypothetical protein